MNRRFVRADDEIPFGAMGFVRAIVPALGALGYSVAYLLYRRDETVGNRIDVQYLKIHGTPAAEVTLSFSGDVTTTRAAFAAAVARLTPRPSNRAPVVYHQTGVTAPFTPHNARCVITHHAPFAHDAIDVLGERRAVDAFAGGPGKLQALLRLQRGGLTWLRTSPDALAVEISMIQQRLLWAAGVPRARCMYVPPPVDVGQDAAATLPPTLAQWMACTTGRIRVLTAAARLDGFKNLEQVARAAGILHRRGYPTALYVAAGDECAQRDRDALRELVPADMRPWTSIEPRVSAASLNGSFKAVAGTGVFAFPSRYETLGITPLQAMRCGLAVAIPKGDRIGALDHAPEEFHYRGGVVGLAEKIQQLARLNTTGDAQTLARERVADLTPELFVRRFDRALQCGSDVSSSAHRTDNRPVHEGGTSCDRGEGDQTEGCLA